MAPLLKQLATVYRELHEHSRISELSGLNREIASVAIGNVNYQAALISQYPRTFEIGEPVNMQFPVISVFQLESCSPEQINTDIARIFGAYENVLAKYSILGFQLSGSRIMWPKEALKLYGDIVHVDPRRRNTSFASA